MPLPDPIKVEGVTLGELVPHVSRSIQLLTEILSLQDWNITVALLPAESMPSPEHYAECDSTTRLKRAHIKLRGTDLRQIDDVDDLEQTIIHELLHLHFDFMARVKLNPEHAERYEQAIELIARGIKRILTEARKDTHAQPRTARLESRNTRAKRSSV